MKVLVTGASGLIGSALIPALEASGHEVVKLVRRNADPRRGTFEWNPNAGTIDGSAFAGIDAVVHLAGETVAGRWTDKKKQAIYNSRIFGTRLLAEELTKQLRKPKVFACASAIGYYGDRGDEVLTEASSAGDGFLARVVSDWEAETRPIADAGIRVVNLRTGIVLSREDGALAQMLTPFKLGVGGPIGGGKQQMSWISIGDCVSSYHRVLSDEQLSGPINNTSPNPVSNAEFSKTLGKVLGRPAILPTPSFVLKAAYGQFATEGLFSSAHVVPARLLAAGHVFRDPELEAALRVVLKG